MPDLNISTEMVGDDICVVRVGGFLDAHTFEQMDEAINELFDKNVFKIVSDLSDLEYISSAGAGVFIGALAMAQENQGDIILTNATPNVYEVFDLLGLTQIFTLADSVDEGVAQMSA